MVLLVALKMLLSLLNKTAAPLNPNKIINFIAAVEMQENSQIKRIAAGRSGQSSN